MSKKTSNFVTSLSALITACAMAVVFSQPVVAQTAKKLKCKGCVKSKQLKNGQVKNADLAANAVDGGKIADGSVTALDIADEAGADFVEGPAAVSLTGGHDLISTISVTAPTAGTVIVDASGVFGPAVGTIAECSITTATVTGGASSIILWTVGGTGALPTFLAVPFAGTRGFQVGPGTTDINLVCRDASASVSVGIVQMTAMFFPTRY